MRALFVFYAVIVSAIFSATPTAAADEIPRILVTGRIWIGNPQQPWAEAIAIEGDRIAFVGGRADAAKRAGRSAKVIDAGERLVAPGMIDAHIHLIDGGLRLASVQLRDASTQAEFARRIAEFARQPRRDGAWITGGDWDHTLWGASFPIESGLTKRLRRRQSGFRVSMGTWRSRTPRPCGPPASATR